MDSAKLFEELSQLKWEVNWMSLRIQSEIQLLSWLTEEQTALKEAIDNKLSQEQTQSTAELMELNAKSLEKGKRDLIVLEGKRNELDSKVASAMQKILES